MPGKAGFRSGYVNASNIKMGDIQFTALQQTVSVSFDNAYRNADPVVMLTSREDPAASGTTLSFVSTRSKTGFTAKRGDTGSAQDVSWVAIDQDKTYRD